MCLKKFNSLIKDRMLRLNSKLVDLEFNHLDDNMKQLLNKPNETYKTQEEIFVEYCNEHQISIEIFKKNMEDFGFVFNKINRVYE